MTGSVRNWRAVFYLTLLSIVEVFVIGVSGLVFSTIAEENSLRPEAFLTLLLLSGVIALVAMLVTAVGILGALGLTDPSQSFGLPEGTIRAIIALSLIVIFAMASIYLYAQLGSPHVVSLRGLTQEQVASLPTSQILSVEQNPRDNALRNVLLAQPLNTAAEDFAKQILTTMGTLVVAVSAFYFGAKSVAATRAAPNTSTLRIISPDSPYTPAADQKQIIVSLTTEPPGLAIEARVGGTPDASLAQINHDVFQYSIPAPPPSQDVDLSFRLAIDPSVKEHLIVRFPPRSE